MVTPHVCISVYLPISQRYILGALYTPILLSVKGQVYIWWIHNRKNNWRPFICVCDRLGLELGTLLHYTCCGPCFACFTCLWSQHSCSQDAACTRLPICATSFKHKQFMIVCMFNAVQDVSDPVTNITMYGTEENKMLPHRCPTTSKLIHGVSSPFSPYSFLCMHAQFWSNTQPRYL